jgi:hypothetical protein
MTRITKKFFAAFAALTICTLFAASAFAQLGPGSTEIRRPDAGGKLQTIGYMLVVQTGELE